ncbi:MAG: hypothetical protein JSW37_13260 [Anaerolineales bacterium]|nr:MAG: hypothetical protein JSW37_13260 [Anaerolineales bacterium]
MAWTDWYKTVTEQMADLLNGAGVDGTEVPGLPVGGHSVVKDLTLSLDTDAYADGDVLADTQELAAAIRVAGGSGVVQSLVVVDKDDQGQAMDVYLLDSSGSLGTENSAVAVSDANAAKILGKIAVGSGDYYDMGGVRVASLANLSLVVEVSSGTSLYVGVVSRGAGTYTASGVVLRFGILQD